MNEAEYKICRLCCFELNVLSLEAKPFILLISQQLEQPFEQASSQFVLVPPAGPPSSHHLNPERLDKIINTPKFSAAPVSLAFSLPFWCCWAL